MKALLRTIARGICVWCFGMTACLIRVVQGESQGERSCFGLLICYTCRKEDAAEMLAARGAALSRASVAIL